MSRKQLEPRRERLETLDVLRGVAVLGIYVVNVQAFAMIPQAYQNPTLSPLFGPEARSAATFVVVFFESKFLTIFSTLFGAGMALMAGRGEEPRRLALHRRRMWWLLVIGLLHAYLVWFGDILVPYAIAGLFVVSALPWRVSRLVWTGLALIAASSGVYAFLAFAAATMPPEEYAEAAASSWAISPEAAQVWREALRSSWLERLPRMIGFTAQSQISVLMVYLPRTAGLMMIGIALFRADFFSSFWRAERLGLLALLAPAGALGSWAAAEIGFATGFDLVASAPGVFLSDVASIAQALGYAALVMLTCRPAVLAWLRAPFARAGRMAITNYLGCSLFSAWYFYGPPGLGRVGRLDHVEQLQMAGLVCLGMLTISTLWLAAFRFGPVEWAWRSLTYRRAQPLLRAEA